MGKKKIMFITSLVFIVTVVILIIGFKSTYKGKIELERVATVDNYLRMYVNSVNQVQYEYRFLNDDNKIEDPYDLVRGSKSKYSFNVSMITLNSQGYIDELTASIKMQKDDYNCIYLKGKASCQLVTY